MVRMWRDAKVIPHIHLNDLTVVSSMTDYACFLYKKQTFSLQPRRFLVFCQIQPLMFLKCFLKFLKFPIATRKLRDE